MQLAPVLKKLEKQSPRADPPNTAQRLCEKLPNISEEDPKMFRL